MLVGVREEFNQIYKFFTSIEEFPLYEFLHPNGLQADPNKPNIVLLEDWLQSGYLLCTQSAEGSSKAAEEDDHASVILPQVAVLNHLFGKNSVHQVEQIRIL